MYTQEFIDSIVPYVTLFKPFTFNPLDYHGSLERAKDQKLLAILDGASSAGFILLFALGMYIFNPPLFAWALMIVVGTLLAHRTHWEILRYSHAKQWISHYLASPSESNNP